MVFGCVFCGPQLPLVCQGTLQLANSGRIGLASDSDQAGNWGDCCAVGTRFGIWLFGICTAHDVSLTCRAGNASRNKLIAFTPFQSLHSIHSIPVTLSAYTVQFTPFNFPTPVKKTATPPCLPPLQPVGPPSILQQPSHHPPQAAYTYPSRPELSKPALITFPVQCNPTRLHPYTLTCLRGRTTWHVSARE